MKWSQLKERARTLLGLDQTDRELEDEIAYHIELETARQLQDGHNAATARKRALEKFGNPRRIAEETRDERITLPLAGSIEDIKWATRTLRRNAAFTALAIMTLAVGIGTTTVAFAALDTVLLRPLGFARPEQLVVIKEQTAEKIVLPPSYPNFADWRNRARSFSGVVSELLPSGQTALIGDEPLRVNAMGVSRGFFSVLGIKPMIGRDFSTQENAPGGPSVAMVSHSFWVDQLGSRKIPGMLRLGDRVVDIVGVLPPALRLVGDADIFLPHEQNPGTSRTASNYVVIARLAPNVTIESARAEMSLLSRALVAEYGDATKAADVVMTPLVENIIGKENQMIVVVVFAAAMLVMLIACTNLISAQLARGLGRGREIAVRVALGASRTRLIRQLLAESAVLSVVGALLGFGVTIVLTPMLRVVGAPLVPRLVELSVDGRTLMFVAGLAVLTVMLIGLYPALRLVTSNPSHIIRGASRNPVAGVRSRAWPLLVGFEIAIAVVLVVGSTLLVRTMHNIMTSDFGLDPRGILTASLTTGTGLEPWEIERVRAELAALPGVSGAAVVTRSPLEWWNQSGPVLRPSDAPQRWPATAGFRIISQEYFSVMRQRIVKGRAFTIADDSTSPTVAIVTPGLASTLWPGENAIGKTIRTVYRNDQWLTVVGVVAEASHWSMARGAQHEIFVPLAQQPKRSRGQIILMVRTDGDVRALVPAVRSRVRAFIPSRPITFDTMNDQIARSAADRRFAMFAVATFAAISLLLSVIGIHSVVSFAVRARTHEMGVRMALGATPFAVQLHVLRDAATMTIGGVLVGVGASLFATLYVKSLLYGVTRLDPGAYLGATLFLIVTALLGAYLPARRSSQADPLTALRGE